MASFTMAQSQFVISSSCLHFCLVGKEKWRQW